MNGPMAWLGGALIFFAELLMYVGLVVFARHLIDGPAGWVVGAGAVVIVAALWMRHLSPKATMPVQPHIVALAVRETVLFGGAAAWYFSGNVVPAVVMVALAVVGTVIGFFRPFVHVTAKH